jgi:hypothetical protein
VLHTSYSANPQYYSMKKLEHETGTFSRLEAARARVIRSGMMDSELCDVVKEVVVSKLLKST